MIKKLRLRGRKIFYKDPVIKKDPVNKINKLIKMPQEACRLCGQTNKTFGHTMNDKLITQFLSNAVVVSNTLLFTKISKLILSIS